jgi:hypothetical protein
LVHILQHIKKGISEPEHTLSYYSLSELKWQLVSQLGYHDTISVNSILLCQHAARLLESREISQLVHCDNPIFPVRCRSD